MSAGQAIVFDLDGTLVDSAPGFVPILNAMLAERGSARRTSLAEVRRFASHGGPALVGGVLADECGDLDAEVVDFRARYAAAPTPRECLYPGVAEGLSELARRGHALAICSNKPQHLCEKVVRELGLAARFAAVIGSAPGRTPKPAPAMLELALAGLGARVEDCLYVGDSEVDHALAEAAGARFAFVSYGYAAAGFSPGAHPAFARFADLVRAVKAGRFAPEPARGAA